MISQSDQSEAVFSFSLLEFRVWIYEQLIFQRLSERATAIAVSPPFDRYRDLLFAKCRDFCFCCGARDIASDQAWWFRDQEGLKLGLKLALWLANRILESDLSKWLIFFGFFDRIKIISGYPFHFSWSQVQRNKYLNLKVTVVSHLKRRISTWGHFCVGCVGSTPNYRTSFFTRGFLNFFGHLIYLIFILSSPT